MSDDVSESAEASGNEKKKGMPPLGCLAIVVFVAAIIGGTGYGLHRCEKSSQTPCKQYAETMARELDNCHSGVNRSHRYHINICEQLINPTKECIKRIKTLKCPQLEAGPASSASDVCGK